ncbi:MAG: DNA polymerase III subunit beta [Endomicrobium sp.]|jgi:DNA polymerase-3 subunit beta|nr:DNA polymerase III subunit beta [Endomicrobium sp.]
MNVLCKKIDLLKGMQAVLPVALSYQNKKIFSILSNFVFKVTANNNIELSATNFESSIKYFIPNNNIIKSGQIILPAKKFYDIVRTMSNTDIIEITISDTNKLNIKTDKTQFNLLGITKAEYPDIPDFPKENNLIINKLNLLDAFKKTMFSMSVDLQQNILNSTYLVIKNGILEIVTTDARRLAYIKIAHLNTSTNMYQDHGIIVPSKAIHEIVRLLSLDLNSINVALCFIKNQLAIKSNNMIFLATLISGNYPNYKQIIPEKETLNFKVKLPVKNTLHIMKQMTILTGDKICIKDLSIINLYFNKGICTISASTSGLGFGESKISIDYYGKPVKISCNPHFIKDVLQNIEDLFIIFALSVNLKPIVLYSETNTNYLYVIMPMKAI